MVQSEPHLGKLFLDPSLPSQLYYDSNKTKLAKWQLHQLYDLMKKIASAILETVAIREILTHMKIPHKPPDIEPSRIPTQLRFNG